MRGRVNNYRHHIFLSYTGLPPSLTDFNGSNWWRSVGGRLISEHLAKE